MSAAERGRKRSKVVAKYQEQNGACFWCGLPMLLQGSSHSDLFATYDHLDPRGPQRPLGRHVAAHRVCNVTRHYNLSPHHSALHRVINSIRGITPGWAIMEKRDRNNVLR